MEDKSRTFLSFSLDIQMLYYLHFYPQENDSHRTVFLRLGSVGPAVSQDHVKMRREIHVRVRKGTKVFRPKTRSL
jgi:hypothetical protein